MSQKTLEDFLYMLEVGSVFQSVSVSHFYPCRERGPRERERERERKKEAGETFFDISFA